MKRSLDTCVDGDVLLASKRRVTSLECDFCQEQFEHKRLKVIHMEAHHLERNGSYICNWCNEHVDSKIWADHRKKEIKRKQAVISGTTSKNVSRFFCHIADCGKEFTRAEALRDHVNEHNGVTPHLCDYCGAQYCRKSSLKKHIKALHQ